ncbi:glycerophosphodiester phosphodiesterase family protein [Mangrovicoccus algicola]|uniref:Phosphodiesterase n=1 Tax=Mangrovicoccus algicola TaxID=2771008 RepID=A0A8J6Z0V1_9RHOB|nr:glycerophosphodiester phosphodiesterase family protein [Mangrovicoccus algicola]MBE3640609.1 phosphodiesterase [Mangrovicoccus algicola]
MSVPAWLLSRPIAHRGLHDAAAGIPENSRAAAEAACAAGHPIELDLQPSADGVAMVFHDDDLARLTGETGPVTSRSAAELGRMRLLDSAETVPSFAEFLDLVAGRVPLLVEIKSQPGSPAIATNALVEAALAALDGYEGAVAVMSFNPFAVAHGVMIRPDLPWGITTGHGPGLFPEHPDTDAAITGGATDPRDYGAAFVSHGLRAQDAPWIGDLRRAGVPVLAWTIRSPEEEAMARGFAANITFERYRPDPGPAPLDHGTDAPD